jgi:hypothetical protein
LIITTGRMGGVGQDNVMPAAELRLDNIFLVTVRFALADFCPSHMHACASGFIDAAYHPDECLLWT